MYAQESNYSNYEVGANATMLGGSVVAGVNNISAIYYNPGYLSFIENSSVAIEPAVLFGANLRIKNGAGQEINIKSSFFDVIPSLIGGIIKSKKAKDWTFAYAAITVNSSLIEFNVRNSEFIDVHSSNPGDELYEGLYDYSNKIKENWIGASASKKVNDKFAFGVSVFGVYFSQDYSVRQSAVTNSLHGDTIAFSLASTNLQRDLRFRSAGLVIKAGAIYKFEKSNIGFTITSPTINIDLFAKGDVSETFSSYIPGVIDPPRSYSLYGTGLSTFHKTPIKITLGFQKFSGERTWNASVTYNSAVKEYIMLTSDPQYFDDPVLTKPSLEVFDQAQHILNIAVGYRKDIRDGLSFLGGARTDFNYSSAEFLNSIRFIPKMSYWNLYHITGGVIWYTDKAHLTLGGDYAFGFSSGDLQQVNLSDPLESELLFGEKTTDTQTFHNQINVVFGFGYSF